MAKESGKNSKINKIVTVLRENTRWIRKTDMEYSNGKVGMCLKVTIKMMRERGMVKCIGQMDLYIKENGNEVSSMGWVR